jgi:dCTP deaminase
MILSDLQIRARLGLGDLVVAPAPRDEQFQPASLDLRLADEFRVFEYGECAFLDTRNPRDVTRLVVVRDRPFVLHPGDFCLARTLEHVTIPGRATNVPYEVARYPHIMGNREKETKHIHYPPLVGRVEGRSSIARLGVVIHTCAGFIDPGFSGHITLELANLGRIPVYLWPGDRICQLALFACGEVGRPYGQVGKYQGQVGVTPSKGVR